MFKCKHIELRSGKIQNITTTVEQFYKNASFYTFHNQCLTIDVGRLYRIFILHLFVDLLSVNEKYGVSLPYD